MSTKGKGYEGDGITVYYDVKRCIHAAECVRGVPDVFDPDRRPWIDATQADNDTLAEVIHRCPTGALHYTRTDGGAEEPTPDHNTIQVDPDGPLYVRGDVEVVTPEGRTIVEDTRIALCRCGASKHKPFCDNSHQNIEFAHDGRLGAGGVKAGTDATGPGLRVQPAENGPLLLQGPFTLAGADDETRDGGTAALCRCGASANKPFCDGSHREVGFEG